MPVEALRKQWDARATSAPVHCFMTFEGDALVLGASTKLANVKRSASDEAEASVATGTRLFALLSIAYGRQIEAQALGYVRRALVKQSEGETTLALTHLALSGLPKLNEPKEDARRLFMADGLMKAGVSPRVILQALELDEGPLGELERSYNPDQPRVPAGSGRLSGQWTSGDVAGEAPPDDGGNGSDSSSEGEASANRPIQIADSSDNWAQYLNPIGIAEAAQRKPFNGMGPNNQHDQGVAKAIAWYRANGYTIISPTPFAVDVPGYTTPRIYDFGVQDVSGKVWGAEIKTTKFSTIFLDPAQVFKDVTLYAFGGAPAPALNINVTGIMYVTYCSGCDAIDLRSFFLAMLLKLVKIRVYTEHDDIP